MEDNGFHDHSTIRGKLIALYNRIPWRVVSAVTVLITLLIGMAVVMFRNPDHHSPPVLAVPAVPHPQFPVYSSNPQNLQATKPLLPSDTEFTFIGNESNNVLRSISLDTVAKSKLKSLVIRNAVIDADELSSSLQGAVALETIDIEALDVIGDYNRVYLPKIKSFYYNYLHHANADDFKPADTMKNIVFFVKTPNQEWDFTTEVANLGVNITVWVDGTLIVDVNRAEGVINFNTHYCEDMLEGVKGNFTKLVLSWCKFSKPALVPSGLRYLNLNNAVPPPDVLEMILRKTRMLEEFHGFQPYVSFDEFAPDYYVYAEDPRYQTPVDISLFPASLTRVSLARMALTASNPAAATAVTDLTLEETNITTPVLQNFASMFRNLKSVRLFNAKGLPYAEEKNTVGLLFDQVLRTNVSTIVVTGFGPDLVSDSPLVMRQLAFVKVINSTDFIMQKNNTGAAGIAAWVGRPMTDLEINYKRFEHLRLQDVDTYEDYLLYDSFSAITGASGKPCAFSSFYIITISWSLILFNRLRR